MRVRHVRCSGARYKAISQPDLKGHCGATIKQSERDRERAVLGERAYKMKNNSEALKRQGQKSFPPAACCSDMTNKSHSHHQSPGIKNETRTIDPDAFAPEEKQGVDTETGIYHVCSGAHCTVGENPRGNKDCLYRHTHTAL